MGTVELTAWDAFDLGKAERRDHPDLIVTLHPQNVVRVAFGTHFDGTEGFSLSGTNLIYYETDLIEREPREDEEHPFSYLPNREDPDVIYATELPTIDDLRRTVRRGDLDAYDGLTAAIPDADARDRIVRRLQTNIEEANLKATKLHRWRGNPDDTLDPEWHPESADPLGIADTDDADAVQRHLHQMATHRNDAHLVDWRDILQMPYHEYFRARLRVLDIHEPWLEPYEMVALDVAGADGQTYCRECGGVQAMEAFLHVQTMPEREPDRTVRVCDRCADLYDRFPEAAVSRARDERARETGGQRTLDGEYS